MLPKPMCCNTECGQILFIEEAEWAVGPMGEQAVIVDCPECDQTQRVERFVEVNYMSFQIDEEEALTSEKNEGE